MSRTCDLLVNELISIIFVGNILSERTQEFTVNGFCLFSEEVTAAAAHLFRPSASKHDSFKVRNEFEHNI